MSNDINLKLFAFNYADAPKSPLIKGEVEELIQLKQINIKQIFRPPKLTKRR